VASYGRALRQRIEALLLGSAGTSRVLEPGRFHLRAPDRTLDGHPLHSSERAVEVVLEPGTPLVPINTLDTTGFYRHRLTVRVRYALTRAGGDLAEGLGEQVGSATLDDVRDRAVTDAADIYRVLTYHENRAGTDPAILSCQPDGEPLGPIDDGDDVAVMELGFLLDVEAAMTAYAP
jgi:hypothetical protein